MSCRPFIDSPDSHGISLAWRAWRDTTSGISLKFAVLAAGFLGSGVALADPQFIDRSGDLPLQHIYSGGWEHFVGGGVALFDCNGDRLPDVFAAGGDSPANLLVNISEPGGAIAFKDGHAPVILGTTGAYPLDIDSDGLMDLMVLRNGANQLLRGTGDCRFKDATAALNLPTYTRWSTAFAAMWQPDQSLPTLAIGNYVDATNPDGPFGTCDTNWLIRPGEKGYATPLPLDPGYCPLSMLFSDWQRDGHPLLRISNDRQYYVRNGYEQMWSLDPVKEWGAAEGWTPMRLWGMGIASQDITGDGLPDVMLTSMGDQMLMANTGAGFATVPYTTGTFAHKPYLPGDGRPSTGWHAEFGDMDNDGLVDLFIAKGNVDQMPGMAMEDPNNLLMQRPDGTFEEKGDVAGIATTARSRGAGLVDLNNDGLLDIVVNNRRAPLEIWQNATEGAGNWLAVDLHQQGVNPRAVGAFVELRIGERVQTKELTIGGGHVSGQAAPLHFGLGSASEAEVRVIWPDQTATAWTAIRANQRTRITKSTSP